MSKPQVDEKTLSPVQELISERLDTMEQDVYYTAEKLLGTEFWQDCTTSERITLGSAVANLVKSKRLPLIRGPNSSSNKAQYRSP